MIIHVEVIPHKQQRYDTVGDWQFLGNNLHIDVSDTGSRLSNELVVVHELVEALLCRAAGIIQGAVDTFDVDYEDKRKEGDVSEPGNSPAAPYYRQHVFADIVERMLARELNVNWDEHSARVEAM